jgi:hypothetical protein
MNGGWLYVTTSFVCFDTLLQQGDARLAFKIEDVREVKKHRFSKVVDNGIKFAMKTGKKHFFSGFQKRDQALRCVLSQAKQLDCILGQKERDKSRTPSTEGGHMGSRIGSYGGANEDSETSDWSESDSEESTGGGGSSYRTTDAGGGKKKGIKSKIARKLGHKGKHGRSQSSVDPAEARAAATEALSGRSALTSSARNVPKSANSSPLVSRARGASKGQRGSLQVSISQLQKQDDDDDDDDDSTADMTSDDDESDDSEYDLPRSQSTGSRIARSSTALVVPSPSAAPGSASPFSKGHRRGMSVDNTALKKVAQEGGGAGLAIPGGSLDQVDVRGSSSASSSGSLEKGSSIKGHVKGEKKAGKEHAKEEKAAAKLEAREAKEQKRKQERAQKKTAKLVKRFALTENSKFLRQLKCTYVSGSLKGKLYIITNCVCFYSSAIAGVTKIVVPWGAVNSVSKRQEKKGDGIELATNDNNFVFVGFDDRDEALAEITQRWQAVKKRS